MSEPSHEHYNLLLLGRTENGKSSTGNAILGKNAFKTGNRSKDDVIEFDSSLVDGIHVQVVDGSGTGDTRKDAERDIQSLLTHIQDTLWRYVLNFNAIILVLKYGVRFTKQEKDAVEQIKSIFGQDVLKNWGVIVLTHGDNFDMDHEDGNGTFEDWIKEQKGDIQNLISECNNRCVLFNNRTKEENQIRFQREKLLGMVKTIRRKPYTDTEFQEAGDGHIHILVQSQLPILQKRADEMIDKINEQLAAIQNHMSLPPNDCLEKLHKLSRELESFKVHLNQEDRSTGLVMPILIQFSVVEMSLESTKKRCYQLLGRQPGCTQPPVPTGHHLGFKPAEEHHVSRRPSGRSWFFKWSSKECLALAGVVVVMVSVVTLVFASRYADF